MEQLIIKTIDGLKNQSKLTLQESTEIEKKIEQLSEDMVMSGELDWQFAHVKIHVEEITKIDNDVQNLSQKRPSVVEDFKRELRTQKHRLKILSKDSLPYFIKAHSKKASDDKKVIKDFTKYVEKICKHWILEEKAKIETLINQEKWEKAVAKLENVPFSTKEGHLHDYIKYALKDKNLKKRINEIYQWKEKKNLEIPEKYLEKANLERQMEVLKEMHNKLHPVAKKIQKKLEEEEYLNTAEKGAQWYKDYKALVAEFNDKLNKMLEVREKVRAHKETLDKFPIMLNN